MTYRSERLANPYTPYKASPARLLSRPHRRPPPPLLLCFLIAPIMPIVSGDTTFISGDVTDWSHSTIFSIDGSTYRAKNVPALTTLWTPPSGCSNRWMADFVTAIMTPLLSQINTPALLRRATMDGTFEPVTTTPETRRGIPYSGTFVAFSINPRNTSPGTLYDSSYILCQPYGAHNYYSPGICPNGQTVAEITEYHYSTTSRSIATSFEASCCQR